MTEIRNHQIRFIQDFLHTLLPEYRSNEKKIELDILLHISETGGGDNIISGWVAGLEGSGEILGTY